MNFQGGSVRYLVECAEGIVLDVLRPGSDRPRLNVGDTIEVSAAPEHVLVFQAEGAEV